MQEGQAPDSVPVTIVKKINGTWKREEIETLRHKMRPVTEAYWEADLPSVIIAIGAFSSTKIITALGSVRLRVSFSRSDAPDLPFPLPQARQLFPATKE